MEDTSFDCMASKEDCILDYQAVQDKLGGKSPTKSDYRKYGIYPFLVWEKYFGVFKEFQRQADLLEANRKQKKFLSDTAKHASYDKYQDFYYSEILPYYNKYQIEQKPSKIKRIKVCSDLHDIEINRFCWHVFVEDCRRTQPDIVIFNGDIYDLYEFSKYNIDPRNADVSKRFKFVRNLFKQIREVCPNAQIDLFAGNHEIRLLTHLADKSPYLRVLLSDVLDIEFSDIFGLDEFRINWVSKLDLKAFTASDLKNKQKENYKIYFDAYCVCHIPEPSLMTMPGTNGHHHQLSIKSIYDPIRGPGQWVQTPGMHGLHAEYVGGALKWNLGFLDVFINVETKEVSQSSITVYPEWAICNGVYYSIHDMPPEVDI